MDTLNVKINDLKSRISASKVRILASFPFYGVLIMEMKFFLDDKEKTFSTNGKDIYFNPNYLCSLNEEELDISILHEIMHILLKHPFRYKKSMNNDLYHLAADIVVNSNIMHSNERKEPLFVKGKELPHLTPNEKEGYLFTTEEVYRMLLRKYPDMANNNQDEETSEEEADQDNSNDESDTFEKQIGPKRIDKAFKFIPDVSGYFYFRTIAFKNYIGNWDWNIEDDYKCLKYSLNPQLFVQDKLSKLMASNKLDFEITSNKIKSISLPDYPTDLKETYFDLETIKMSKKDTFSFYNAKTTDKLLDDLDSTQFSNKQLINDEKQYRKFVYKTFLGISNLHKTYFKKFASDRKLIGDKKSLIIACRNAIAQSAKYDLNFKFSNNGKDEVLEFLAETKRGICLHFATALVLLYRALGIPARFTIGYLVKGTKNKSNDGYIQDGHAWVEVYLDGTGWIRMDPTPVSSNGSGSSGGNSSSGNKNDNSFDSHERWEELKDSQLMDEDEINSRIIKAYDVQNDGSHGYGNVPGFIETLVKSLKEPQIDWRTVLNEFVQENVVDFSFLYPDTRMQDSDFILPSFTEKDTEIKNVLFMVDCSGSMSDDDIADCFSEIQGSINQFDGKLKGFVGFFDTMVYRISEIDDNTDILKLKPVGRGGTNFNCVFNYIKQKMTDNLPTTIIILTDGDAPYPRKDAALEIPTMWVINNQHFTPPWGKVLRITNKGEK